MKKLDHVCYANFCYLKNVIVFFVNTNDQFYLGPSKIWKKLVDLVHFYETPFAKFWTNTICYLGYLILLSAVLILNQTTSISFLQILLWVNIAAIVLVLWISPVCNEIALGVDVCIFH